MIERRRSLSATGDLVRVTVTPLLMQPLAISEMPLAVLPSPRDSRFGSPFPRTKSAGVAPLF
jgi:hypothetical protein